MNKEKIKWLKGILRNIQPRRKEQVIKSKKQYKRKRYDTNTDYSD